MGKGDKKSKKGKIAIGSYGNSRKKNAIKARVKRSNTGGKTSEEAPKEKRTTKKKAAEA